MAGTQDVCPIEPLTKKDLEACDGISEAINRWFMEYTKPGPNGISEAEKEATKAFLARLYTPQERFIRKLYEQLDKEENHDGKRAELGATSSHPNGRRSVERR